MINVKLNHKDAKLPQRANSTDAGADVFSVEEVTINPNERAFVDTGISVQVAHSPVYELMNAQGLRSYLRIAPRSGLAYKNGIDVLAGVIDLGYTGNIKVGLYNTGKEPFTVKVGDKIAQLIREVIHIDEFTEVAELDTTDRGTGSFGSTGVR